MESLPADIRMMILNYLPNTDLLECSLVNKRLKDEARSVMRDRGSLLTKLKFHEPCHQMEGFVSMLHQMKVIPFAGIHFQLQSHHRAQCTPWSAELTNRIHKGLCCLSWKQLSLSFQEDAWWENKKCPAFLLAKKIARDSSRVLEKLSLNIGSERQDFIQEFLQGCRFPRLKVLSLGEAEVIEQSLQRDYSNYMRALVSRAPNLQELHIENDIDLMENVLEGSSAVLVIHDEYFELTENISESLVGAMRLETLDLGIYERDFSVERYNRIIPMLLRASSKSLSSMEVDLAFALPLMSHGVCLENMRKFALNCDNYDQLERYHRRALKIVKKFDFTRIFPALDEVSVVTYDLKRSIGSNILNEFVEHANAILKAPLEDRAANIKKLSLNTVLHSAPFYKEMFPHVETLSTSAFKGEFSSYHNTWEHWRHLKGLEIKINDLCEGDNLDSAFCGIFRAEVDELRWKDDEYLRRVNIVPVMPSITCLKEDLRDLKIVYDSYHVSAPQYDNPTAIFSKVSALIVFARWPTLAVTLKTSIPKFPQVLSHLSPHVTFDVEPRYGGRRHCCVGTRKANS